ncbi:MAG TPA: zinc ribbon domain-containing protein [Pseudoneobacillus sp.]|nr:zinc ribbon domain-containing protein [Pseudoneobacillus sp.]
MSTNKNCQSCGMPFSRDENGGGTEKNGTKSSMYCSHCYLGGEFTLPHINVTDMKDLVSGKLSEFKIPKFLHGFFTRNIHKLERWK